MMTRRELIEKVHAGLHAEGALSTRQIAEVIDRSFAAIAEAIRDEGGYTHPGFGAFQVKVRSARPGRHPKTGEPLDLPATATVDFKPAADLKASLKP
ncbi:MAG: HU family DNA-binding protein [Byssovorax sp.]